MADIKISQLGEALVVTDNDVWPMTASGVTNKVKASTMKSYMVDDLEVSDLYDTTITTPTDNDGLVYDATAQKWENKPVVTGDLWVKNGAHNLLPFPYNSGGTQVITNVTVTVNSNGTLTASGTASGTGSFYYLQGKLPKNDYKIRFVGTLSGVAVRVYDATAYTVLAEVTSSGTDVTFEIDATNENHTIWIYVEWDSAGAISINGGTLLRLATDPSTEYTPYAMTNGELTAEVVNVTKNYSVSVPSSTSGIKDAALVVYNAVSQYLKYNGMSVMVSLEWAGSDSMPCMVTRLVDTYCKMSIFNQSHIYLITLVNGAVDSAYNYNGTVIN